MAAALAAGRVTAAHARALGRCLTPRTLDAGRRWRAVRPDGTPLGERAPPPLAV